MKSTALLDLPAKKEAKESIYSEIADWFLSQGEDKGLTYLEIGIKACHIRHPEVDSLPPNARSEELKRLAGQLTLSQVSKYVGESRLYLENRYQKTIVSIRGYGYKLANRVEASNFMAQHVYKWFQIGTRILRGMPCVDRSVFRANLQKTMSKVNKVIDHSQEVREEFLLAYETVHPNTYTQKK